MPELTESIATHPKGFILIVNKYYMIVPAWKIHDVFVYKSASQFKYWISAVLSLREGICPQPIRYFPFCFEVQISSIYGARLGREVPFLLNSLEERGVFCEWEMTESLPVLIFLLVSED